MKNKFIYLSILVAGLVSCEPEFENAVDANYTAGEADFSTYVAVGNSLTAGYMDGTVYKSGQANSFPNLLAQQFAHIGGGVFTQPSYEEDVNNLGGIQGLAGTRLVIDASQGRPENLVGTPTITLTPQAKAYNNMGVPGAKSFHLLVPGYGALNPYFARHATTTSATVLGDAVSLNPTFFTNWIGANDVLAYATSGGSGVDRTGNPDFTQYGPNDITDPTLFAGVYNLIINGGTNPLVGTVTGLAQNGAKGVVCTIPSVTSIPYFTTVPYNPVSAELVNANPQAPLLIQLYQFLAVATNGRISPLSTVAGTTNPILIKDEDLSDLGTQITNFANGSGNPLLIGYAAQLGAIYGKARQATAADLVVLTASSVIATPNSASIAPFDINGVTYPLANQWVLTTTEQTKVTNATNAYNNAIIAIAATKNLAVADMNAVLNQLISGLQSVEGSIYTANYFSGAATENKVLFSLDGVHPNARGYAVIANEFIKVINSHYKSNMPYLNPAYYPGINIVLSN